MHIAKKIISPLLIAFTILAASLALADDVILTGSADREWLITATGQGKDAQFDVLTRKIGNNFQPAYEEFKGTVLAAQAIGEKLFIMPEGGAFGILSADGTAQTGRNQIGQLLAICPAAKTQNGNSENIIAMFASLEPPARLEKLPTTKPAGEWINIYQTFGLDWKPIAATQAKATSGLMAADDNGTIYIVLKNSKGQINIIKWTADGGFEKAPAPKESDDSKIVALLKAKGSVYAIMSKIVKDKTSLSLTNLTTPDKAVEIKSGNELLTFPADTKLKFTTLGQEFAVYYKADSHWMLTLFDTQGRPRQPQNITEMLRLVPDVEKIKEISEYFSLALIGSIFAVMFLTKPAVRGPQLLLLPKGIRPANLLKRTAAFLIDFVIILLPFVIAMSLWITHKFGITHEQLNQQIQQLQHDPMELIALYPELIYFSMAAVIVLAVYGILMESKFGWTVGKKLIGLKVVTDNGAKPSLRSALLRNQMKIIEIMLLTSNFLLMLILLLVIVLLNRYRQRFGDMVARTVVTEPGEMAPLPIPPFMQPPNQNQNNDNSDEQK